MSGQCLQSIPAFKLCRDVLCNVSTNLSIAVLNEIAIRQINLLARNITPRMDG